MAGYAAIKASEVRDSASDGEDSAPPISDVWPPVPDISHLIVEDDEPVDSIFSEKQQRLLTEPLYSSWSGPPPEENSTPRPFAALANVGFFTVPQNTALVPDVMLSADVHLEEDLTKKENLSYFLWKHGKPPDVVIEVVSNREGSELDVRLRRYRRARVPYYIVYDPFHHLGQITLHAFRLIGGSYEPMVTPRFPGLGLCLVQWQGTFEQMEAMWLRWATLSGEIIPTGAERADGERERADEALRRADDALRRADDERRRADDERRRADDERRRADDERRRAEQLAELLRAHGIDPAR